MLNMQILNDFNFKTSIVDDNKEVNDILRLKNNFRNKYNFTCENVCCRWSKLFFEGIDNARDEFINFLPENYEFDAGIESKLKMLFNLDENLMNNFQLLDEESNARSKNLQRLESIVKNSISELYDSNIVKTNLQPVLFEIKFTALSNANKKSALRVFGFYDSRKPDIFVFFLFDPYHLVFPGKDARYEKIRNCCTGDALKHWGKFTKYYNKAITVKG